MMGPILQFIRPFDRFDAAAMTVAGEAFDKALLSLRDTGQPSIVREVIAHRVLDLLAGGERDVERLCSGALFTLQRPVHWARSSIPPPST